VEFDRNTEIFTIHKNDRDDEDSLPENSISAVLEDRTGILWISSTSGMFSKYDKNARKFRLYRPNPKDMNSLSHNIALPRLEDGNGDLWIGTLGGLDKYDRTTGRFTHYRHDPDDEGSIPNNYSCGVYEDREGSFWVGSFSGGLCKFDRDSGYCTQKADIKKAYTMAQDRKDSNILWIGTYKQGLYKYDKYANRILRQYKHEPDNPESLSHNIILRFIIDRDNPNSLWLATSGGGLEKFDRTAETFTHYRHDPDDPQSIGSDMVYNIYEDTDGNLWICTDNGLNKFDRNTGTFRHFTQENGYPGRTNQFAMEDNRKNLWIGSDAGLIKFDIGTEIVEKVYTEKDGLHSHAFFSTGFCKTGDGEFWIGGFNGMNSFHPDEIRDNPYVPPVFLTSFTQGGQKMDFGKAVTHLTQAGLGWRHNFFEFEFAALNYTQPEKNQYKYMLKGFDRDWFDSGTRRFGRYTGLPGGTYTLRIIGSNNDGIWNEDGVSIRINVGNPFWRTWWFYGLVVLVGILISLFILQYLKRLKAEIAERRKAENERNSLEMRLIQAQKLESLGTMAGGVAHEINNPINGIMNYAQLIKDRSGPESPSIEFADEIIVETKRVATIVRNLLTFARYEKNSHSPARIQDIVESTLSLIRTIVRHDQIILETDIPDDLPEIKCRSQQIRQVLMNLLTNARDALNEKYPEYHENKIIWISSRVFEKDGRRWIRTTVEDYGPGIAPETRERMFDPFFTTKPRDKGSGLGLSISYGIVQEHHGELDVESEPGQYTKIHLNLPVDNGWELEGARGE